jgi:NTP pyrophosphatase (non-canonical NTP hydrolase)
MRAEQELVKEFVTDRPTMIANNRNPNRMMELLKQEIDELSVEIMAENPDKIAQELPDVVWFCLTIAEIYGIDLENALWAKALRNEAKYPEEYFQDGMSYEEAHTLCRALWSQYGNDKEFFEGV